MPLLGSTIEDRNATFQRLKQPCVALSQASLTLATLQSNASTLIVFLEDLLRTLQHVTSQHGALDAKLADYVFFPISQVLKSSQKLSIRCLELSLECIAILIAQGWKAQIQPQLAAQVAILCTLMAERNPKGFGFGESTNELQVAALSCLRHLFRAAGNSRDSRELLISEPNFPQFGNTISVILDDIHDGTSIEVQITAVQALENLFDRVADREICASFLPGVVSKLTKVLTPTTNQRRNHKVLVGCLGTLSGLLRTTLGDDQQLIDSVIAKSGDFTKFPSSRTSIIDGKWAETAAKQLEPALKSVMRLSTHSREDVKLALARLCLVLLEHCRHNLANCAPLALYTLIAIVARNTDLEQIYGQLEALTRIDRSIAGLLQSALHDDVRSIPTIMQSADETAKTQKLQHIRTTYGLLVNSDAETAMAERMIASTLRDCVVITLVDPGVKREQAWSIGSIPQSLDVSVLHGAGVSTEFGQPLVKYRGQEEVMDAIERFAQHICSSGSYAGHFIHDLTRALQTSQGDAQTANFWLLYVALQSTNQRKDAVSDFVEFGVDDQAVVYADSMEELYSFALGILTDQSDEPLDPRLQALALRTLALRAQTAGRQFRYELVDALYPVLHTLATPDEALQRDSMTALNIFTSVCDYNSVKDLIVENVDYLTNAVALKLNAFDISPQAPQVLLMMMRLAGPSLLPYLQDTIESIFAALEDFHGYPLLVQLLFKVLGVAADEGAKAPLLAITDVPARKEFNVTSEEIWKPTLLVTLPELLKERSTEALTERKAHDDGPQPHPQRPWQRGEVVDEEYTAGRPESEGEDEEEAPTEQDQQVDEPDAPPPAPKTYNLLFKITKLTQHFLPSASPSLQASLLALVRTTVPAIARHENSFLPLINTLWPEIVNRLDDKEPLHVRAAALDTMAVLCDHAGDFMRTRIVDLWPELVTIYQKLAKDIVGATSQASTSTPSKQTAADFAQTSRLEQAVTRMHSSPTVYHGDTSTRLLWASLISSLTTTVEKVTLPPETFDEALEMLQPVLREDRVIAALESKNADAVWLAKLRTGGTSVPVIPTVPKDASWRFAAVPG